MVSRLRQFREPDGGLFRPRTRDRGDSWMWGALLAVAVASIVSLLMLWSSIQTIQRSLPAAHWAKVREFSALHQELLRMEQTLKLFIADPRQEQLASLRQAMSNVSALAKFDLKAQGAALHSAELFNADLIAWQDRLDEQIRSTALLGSPTALNALAQHLRTQMWAWAELEQRARALSHEVYQVSQQGANQQAQDFESLRVHLFGFIGLGAACALALSVSLMRQRAAYRQLQVLGSEVRELAFHDSLTHLANRRLLLDRLQDSLDSAEVNGEMGALLYLDLDQFKLLNDTEGHAAGDELLCQIATRLLAAARPQDTVARLGGDEFVVLLVGLGKDALAATASARQSAEKIRTAFDTPFHLQRASSGLWQRSASIGVAVFGPGTESVESVLREADIALYKAKESGRNVVRVFDSAMQAAVKAHARTEAMLRTALHLQQFSVHYQPVMNLNGELCGAEALARWTLEDGTEVPPAKFILLAEESGLIVPLGQWVLQKACQQWARWIIEFGKPDLRLAVNFSARQIQHETFVQDLQGTLESCGLLPACLVVEVTESAILSNLADIERKLNALKALGVSIALDDFGTGYSSLTYVQRLPICELKIDHTFVSDIGVDAADEAICAATVALARGLNLRIVVEGVETVQQQEFFREKHPTDYLQGYLYSRPLSDSQFHSFAKALLPTESLHATG